MDEQVNVPLKRGHFLGAVLLVAGTCVGGGMLALPLMTGLAGFFPSSLMLLTAWLFMTSTGLLFLEANLWLGSHKHFVSMAAALLGKGGKWITILLYIFICYVSLVAYISGGAELITGMTKGTDLFLSKNGGCLLFGLFFGLFLYSGTSFIGRVNSLLVFGMILSYLAILLLGAGEVRVNYLKYVDWKRAGWALPLLLTSFSFQTMMPSLTPYLRGHVKGLRWAIILGTSVPLAAYLLWNWFILGVIPFSGPHGIQSSLALGLPVTESLEFFVKNPRVYTLASFFAFFALVTSFLGIALGLFDFLSDGFKMPQRNMNKVYLGLLVIVPSIFFAVLYPKAFLVALDVSGGYGDALLNGIIPVLMVWRGRYLFRMKGERHLPGGRISLSLLFLFACGIVALETLLRFHLFSM